MLGESHLAEWKGKISAVGGRIDLSGKILLEKYMDGMSPSEFGKQQVSRFRG